MTRQARQDQAQDVVLPSQPSTRPWPPLAATPHWSPGLTMRQPLGHLCGSNPWACTSRLDT